MRKCRFCGTELTVEQKFCSTCGARVEGVVNLRPTESKTNQNGNANNKAYTQNNAFPKVRKVNRPMLIWSIINTAVSVPLSLSIVSVVSFVLGIIAIAMTGLAKESKTDILENSRIRTAKILNIIASAVLVLAVVICILFFVLMWAIGAYYGNYYIW